MHAAVSKRCRTGKLRVDKRGSISRGGRAGGAHAVLKVYTTGEVARSAVLRQLTEQKRRNIGLPRVSSGCQLRWSHNRRSRGATHGYTAFTECAAAALRPPSPLQ